MRPRNRSPQGVMQLYHRGWGGNTARGRTLRNASCLQILSGGPWDKLLSISGTFFARKNFVKNFISSGENSHYATFYVVYALGNHSHIIPQKKQNQSIRFDFDEFFEQILGKMSEIGKKLTKSFCFTRKIKLVKIKKHKTATAKRRTNRCTLFL